MFVYKMLINTAIGSVLESGVGVARMVPPCNLPKGGHPKKDKGFAAWESIHHPVRVLDQGETAAAKLMANPSYATKPRTSQPIISAVCATKEITLVRHKTAMRRFKAGVGHRSRYEKLSHNMYTHLQE